MNSYSKQVEVRWADMDPNFHLRHSVYYDYGASIRIDFLHEHNITPDYLRENNLGPILLREECVFKREIRPADKVSIDIKVIKATKNFARWTIQHQLIKNEEILSAVLTVDGAWIDSIKRKLTTPPEEVFKTFESMPKAENFTWI
jgi:acyl-CoA thioester hydrolase